MDFRFFAKRRNVVHYQMNLFKLIVLAILFCSCKMTTKRTFNSEVKDLFFQADINSSYDSVLNYYRSLDFLKETEPEGFTTYPPVSALGTDGREGSIHSFQFDRHLYGTIQLERGRLNVDRRGYDKQAISNFVIYYLFKSRQKAEIAYQSLIKKFSSLGTKSKSFKLQEIRYIDFFDSTSNMPGLRISLDGGDELINGNTLSISMMR
jgi:hypothetical protein